MARANPKPAIESELNLETESVRQIWPTMNGLAFKGHLSQTSCFWAKSFTVNNFFSFLNVQQ